MSKKNIILGLLLLSGLVIFLNQSFFLSYLPNQLGYTRYKKGELVVGMSTETSDLSEYRLNLNNLTRTRNIYEGLVAFDRSLRIKPSLAIAWGSLDETTWEFKLRQGVRFHDNHVFNAQSVISSFEKAQDSQSPEIKGVLKNIKEIKIVDPFTIHLITYEPDPLILANLTKFLMSRPNHVGTGPYQLDSWQKGESLNLIAFDDYWGRHPTYKKVKYEVISDKNQREEKFEAGEIDILAAISRDQALSLPTEQIKSRYSLEVNFLMFKLDHPILKDRQVREAIQTLFDPKEIEAIGNYFVRPANQFVAPGVFGYNGDIESKPYKPEDQTKNIFGESRQKITLDFLLTYRTLVDYLQKQLNEAGFLVQENMTTPADLIERIKNNQSPLFIIGWQAENGDAGGFLDQFIHSEGQFNGGRYKNKEVDQLIEQARRELDQQKRLSLLKGIMKKIDDDLIGIPLFESARLYALKEKVSWEPRLDGLVLGAEVK